MKNTLLFTLLCLLPFSSCFSQHVYMEFSGGLSLPLAPYSTKEFGDGNGFANLGGNGNLTLGYRLSDKISLGAKIIFMNNQHGAVIGGLPQGTFVSTLSWSVNYYLLDAKYSQKITEKFFVEVQANAGLLSTKFPNASIRINGRNFTLGDRIGSGFGAGGGLGFRYYTSDSFALKSDIFLMTGQPELETNEYGTQFLFSQNINVLFLNFGVSLDVK